MFTIEDMLFFSTEVGKENFTIKSHPKNYDVRIFSNMDLEHDIRSGKNDFFLIDKNVYNIYFKENKTLNKDKIFLVEAVEENKTLETVTKLISFLEENNFTKGSTLKVIGGGLTQDIGAFVGACFKRGINWIYYPTTLLSMCDSCIGGKTGLNFNKTKNQIALFSSPKEVIINIDFLKTLSDFDIASGMGEVLKLCITGGSGPLSIYKKYVKDGSVVSFEHYFDLITASLAVKKTVVEVDEFEFSYRKSMNYGHTIGHVIESLSNYEIPHGHAVVMGIIIVNKLARNLNILNDTDYKLLRELCLDLVKHSVKKLKNINLDKLKDLIIKDKKTEGNIGTFVLIQDIGIMQFKKLIVDDFLVSEIKEIIKGEFDVSSN